MERRVADLEKENEELKKRLAQATSREMVEIKLELPLEQKENRRILVTGGAGFLGINLCLALLKNERNTVICMDNFASSLPSSTEFLKKRKNFVFVAHDIKVPFDIDVHEIYNLACPASPSIYQINPLDTFKTSVIGIINVMDLMVRRKTIQKMLHTSTSEVYGNATVHPQPESYWGNVNPIGVRACYDEGKRSAECLVTDYVRTFGLRVKLLRIFNTYGPFMRADDGRVISNFIVQALRGDSITIYGDGKQTRSFCYVDDLINGLICVMNSESTNESPLNIGMPFQTEVIEVARMVIRVTQSKSQLVFNELPEDDPESRQPDISKIKALVGWEPVTQLEDGLKKTIEYFKETLPKN